MELKSQQTGYYEGEIVLNEEIIKFILSIEKPIVVNNIVANLTYLGVTAAELKLNNIVLSTLETFESIDSALKNKYLCSSSKTNILGSVEFSMQFFIDKDSMQGTLFVVASGITQ